MFARLSPPLRIWLVLAGLTGISLLVAEEIGLRHVAIVGIFLIAAVKAELIIDHYMEARNAERHWPIMYLIWVAVVTLLLVWGHINTASGPTA
jgi:heme/copper-type cytochrome/quinol oxidase subunit 4